MDLINAVAKARFSSARPQRVQLHAGPELCVDMICMESGQELHIHGGCRIYYVVTGTARFSGEGKTIDLAMGQMAVADANQPHLVTNTGEGRLVCLVYGKPA